MKQVKLSTFTKSRLLFIVLAFSISSNLLTGCSDSDGGGDGLILRDGDTLTVQVVIPPSVGGGVLLAAHDMMDAMAEITGATVKPAVVEGTLSDATLSTVIFVQIIDSAAISTSEEGYRIETGPFGDSYNGLKITARTEIGAMYGFYQIIMDLGVKYHHPEETFFPSNPKATLPQHYNGEENTPDFNWRGFHEHTQHPIVMSDFMLRPNESGYRQYVSNYLKWLTRNRQNMYSFHMLKTVDLNTALPTIHDIIDEANTYGIKVGCYIGFADQQQNAFKLLDEASSEPEQIQIERGIDRIMEGGFDFLGFQIGTSEFTAPDSTSILNWLSYAGHHIQSTYPEVMRYCWIHIACDVKDEHGNYYYHIPLQADPMWGAFVHTTMFYTVDHPAPVYQCEDFTHQREFMNQANGQREMIFFPESAWWLGFDNNCPFPHPLTGWSRAYDIQEVCPDYQVNGHVTFTTGREWTYWQYDHLLTRATWDREFTWDDYLDWIAPMYGERGDEITSFLKDWTDLQYRHFYQENPMTYFYLAGERPEDELGVSRPTKPKFKDVVKYTGAEFNTWITTEYEKILTMRQEYQQLFDRISPVSSIATLSDKLQDELYNSFEMYMRRLDHIITLYEGVIATRDWELEKQLAADENREPDQNIKQAKQAEAEDALTRAKTISDEAITEVAEMENLYRYPLDLVARQKPESKNRLSVRLSL